MTTAQKTTPTVPVLVDTSWIVRTREQVAAEVECGVCLDFRHLDGIGPCPACDPDGYAEHIDELVMALRVDQDGEDPSRKEETG